MVFNDVSFARLSESLAKVEVRDFLQNYFISSHLPFLRDRRNLVDLMPELKKPLEFYFRPQIDVMNDVTLLNLYLKEGRHFLDKESDFLSEFNACELNKKIIDSASLFVEFYDGLITLAGVYAHQRSSSHMSLLGDGAVMRDIHLKISSSEKFKLMNDSFWDLYVCSIKNLPVADDYSSLFSKLRSEALGAVKNVVSGDISGGQSLKQYIDSDVVGFKRAHYRLLSSKKFDFSILESDLLLFKECYHDRITNHLLEFYF